MKRRAEPEGRDGIDAEREGIVPQAEIEGDFGAEILGCVYRRERQPLKTEVVLAHATPDILEVLRLLMPKQTRSE